MEIRISQRLNDILGYAREEAIRTGQYAIAADHLALGILRDADNDACKSLSELGIDTAGLKSFIDAGISNGKIVPFCDSDRIAVGRSAESAINLAAMEALKAGQAEVSPAHLLLAISRMADSVCSDFLAEAGVTAERLAALMKERHYLSNSVKTVTPSPDEIKHIIRISEGNSKIFS